MKQILYAVIDRKHADLIECVGTMAEICAYEGKTDNQIRSAICHAEKRGNKSRYIRIEVEDEGI